MGASCEEIIALASQALTDWDEELVHKVNTIGAQIDESERTIETICIRKPRFSKKVLAPQCFFLRFLSRQYNFMSNLKTGYKSVTFYDGRQLARLVALWYNLVIEIRRIIRLISRLPGKGKFAENFGEFLIHLLFRVARGDEGFMDFPLFFPLCR